MADILCKSRRPLWVSLDGLQCSSMDDKFLQIFALAYMIGWLLARLPKRN